MKIKHYKEFYYILGELKGMARFSDNQVHQLLDVANKLEEAFEEAVKEVVKVKSTVKQKERLVELGAVKRPSAEELEKTTKTKAEEKALEEEIDEKIHLGDSEPKAN